MVQPKLLVVLVAGVVVLAADGVLQPVGVGVVGFELQFADERVGCGVASAVGQCREPAVALVHDAPAQIVVVDVVVDLGVVLVGHDEP